MKIELLNMSILCEKSIFEAIKQSKGSVPVNIRSKQIIWQFLNPGQKNDRYILKEKTINLDGKMYSLSSRDDELQPSLKSIAKVAGTSNKISSLVSLGVGVALTAISEDPEGLILKFNQFLTLIQNVKFLGIFFGAKLQEFIDTVCGQERSRKENLDQSGENKKTRRALLKDQELFLLEKERALEELRLSSSRYDRIVRSSNSSTNKLDTYKVTIFLEGTFLVKSVVYFISWLVKL